MGTDRIGQETCRLGLQPTAKRRWGRSAGLLDHSVCESCGRGVPGGGGRLRCRQEAARAQTPLNGAQPVCSSQGRTDTGSQPEYFTSPSQGLTGGGLGLGLCRKHLLCSN